MEELKDLIREKEMEIVSLRTLLNEKNHLIIDLRSELDKYRSIHNNIEKKFKRAYGISAEPQRRLLKNPTDGALLSSFLTTSSCTSLDGEAAIFPVYEKDADAKNFLCHSLNNSEFMRHLEAAQLMKIVDCMYPLHAENDAWIIQEGEEGSLVYILEVGCVEVSKMGNFLRDMHPGSVFGELAILYNCTRTASVKAKTLCHLWAISRCSFQSIMMEAGLIRQDEHARLLQNVKSLAYLRPDTIIKLTNLLTEAQFPVGHLLLREGGQNDKLFIIMEGFAKITKTHFNQKNSTPDVEVVRYMKKGDHFGEKAIQQSNYIEFMNVIAMPPNGVTCLCLERSAFHMIVPELMSLEGLFSTDDYDEAGPSPPRAYEHLCLSNLVYINTLGLGGFGRVDLVQIDIEREKTFALKRLKKHHVVQTRQQEHVMNERNILLRVDSPFIVRLYRTFKDRKYLYLMMEACLGGEVWTILRDRVFFQENQAKFYIACVLQAVEYLHDRGIIYRDLKPENLLLDSRGYCKLTDFGFAKQIGFARKTWTFCGTPEYVAPEIILNKGHDLSADYWSLGILIYELLSGTPPFSTSDPMITYNVILKGIDSIPFFSAITRPAANLIRKLCRDVPSDRLGYGNNAGICVIRGHLWFDGFNWSGLRNRVLDAPIVNKINGPTDVSNFDEYSVDELEPPDDLSGWDEDF